jgi:hypothetical protein
VFGPFYGTTNLECTPADVRAVYPFGEPRALRPIGIGIQLRTGSEYYFKSSAQANILSALLAAGFPVEQRPRKPNWVLGMSEPES